MTVVQGLGWPVHDTQTTLTDAVGDHALVPVGWMVPRETPKDSHE